MPTFDFQCAKCDHVFEFSRPFGSKKQPVCTACGSKRTMKLIAPPAVHFKGAGWYKTDSKANIGEKKDSTKGTKATKGVTEGAKVTKGKEEVEGKKESKGAA